LKVLSNRNGSYLTGTALADAVFRYAFALAELGRIDTIDIPVFTADRVVVRLQITVGQFADVNIVEHPSEDPELIDQTTTARLTAKADGLTRSGEPFTPEEVGALPWLGW
jgi:hypothetical protein